MFAFHCIKIKRDLTHRIVSQSFFGKINDNELNLHNLHKIYNKCVHVILIKSYCLLKLMFRASCALQWRK